MDIEENSPNIQNNQINQNQPQNNKKFKQKNN